MSSTRLTNFEGHDTVLLATVTLLWGFPGRAVVKNQLPLQETQEKTGSIPGSGRSPGEGSGNPLPYSCLENPMDRET